MTNEMQKQLTLQNSLLETSKEERSTFINQVIEAISNGQADPLKVHLQVKCTEELVKALTSNEQYREIVLSEASRYGRSFEFHNAAFQVKEAGVKYDFSNCGDEDLNRMTSELEALQSRIKERQTFLKTIPGKGLETLTADGELVTLFPPSKSSTTTIAVTLK
jgi:hypothetical protein